MFFLLHRHDDDAIFDDLPKISFISEYFCVIPVNSVVRFLTKAERTKYTHNQGTQNKLDLISDHFPKISEDFEKLFRR